MDEVILVGGSNKENTNYYLHNGNSCFTMTPESYKYTSFIVKYYYPYVMIANNTGKLLQADVYTENGYRPVISIANFVYWESGDGSASNPYIPKFEVIPTYQFTINPTPSDANVVIKVNSETVSNGQGISSISVKYNDEISYTVSRDGYFENTNSYTMGKGDYTINIDMNILLLLI